MENKYTKADLIRVGKRLNNSKRDYLYINPMQGKHIPANPAMTKRMCHTVSSLINCKFPKDRIFLIGFAETATGMAACVCEDIKNALYYQHTTREKIKTEEIIYFTESHSHAIDQKLVGDGLQGILKEVDRVIFFDDEITTGNTIFKLIRGMREMFPDYLGGFSICSIINSMSNEREREFEEQGIDCLHLIKIDSSYGVDHINKGLVYKKEETTGRKVEDIISPYRCINSLYDPRFVVEYRKYRDEVLKNVLDICEDIKVGRAERILILGTEEFMYPAIVLGDYLERQVDCKVKMHATTRSPICVSDNKDYPLHNRYKLNSFYEYGRETYIYDIDKYDQVIILTDSLDGNEGLMELMHLLRLKGNDCIVAYKWCYKDARKF